MEILTSSKLFWRMGLLAGLSLLALSLGNWIGLLSIALVSWLLLRFTGVARMEQRTPSLRPEYRDYQRQTRPLYQVFESARLVWGRV
ncbi:MAG: hypothetical protein CM15mP120_05280 [Pseudomonadota bacterium]|nr:MAG: hypothetical protein CM15mP120_05280 [Pseudomonadota bacterium]